MNFLDLLLLIPLALAQSLDVSRGGRDNMAHQCSGAEKTATIVNAAQAFLELLDADASKQALMPYEFQEKANPVYFKHPKLSDFYFVGEQYGQSVWTNFPISDVKRSGLRLGDMTSGQHDAAMNLLREALSDRGYSKVQDILSADQALADKGQQFASGRANYVLGIFGQPSVKDIWMIQFGGHHLGLNIALSGSSAALAPVLTGAQPANWDESERALAAESDKGFALLESMTDLQRQEAVIDHDVSDLLVGPGEDQRVLPAAGVQASALDSNQQEMLFDLIQEWAGILNTVHSAARLEELQAGLNETYFAWSGPQTRKPNRNIESYFRITGPNLIIEFAPQFPGGDLTQHVHTAYRDHIRAYGRSFLPSQSHVGNGGNAAELQQPFVAI